MKKGLPDNVKISQDAVMLVAHLATEYICFVTSEANDLSIAGGGRSILPQDLIDATRKLDLQTSFLAMQHFVKKHDASACASGSALVADPSEESQSDESFNSSYSSDTSCDSTMLRNRASARSLLSQAAAAHHPHGATARAADEHLVSDTTPS